MYHRTEVIGNVGRDAELRYGAEGGAFASFSVAATEKWKDKAGQPQEHTEWYSCTISGKLAESVSQYIVKGASIFVAGQMRTRKYQKDGIDKYATELRVQELKLLGSKGGKSEDKPVKQAAKPGSIADLESDIPFNRMGAQGEWRVL